MAKKQRNTPERALMLVQRRVEQNYRSGAAFDAPTKTFPASIPGGARRRKSREATQ
jgi:hypothetical protein